jgi:acyl transferase domain-containing protein/thioesterase domain-containing protein
MGRELYETEIVFRTTLDDCAERLKQHLGLDLRQALYPPQDDLETWSQRLSETWLTQPALFAVEYSLAQWWMSLGLHPQAMVGHSIGEYVAACLAQVFSLDDALDIVAFRGRQIYDLPSGSMLAIPLAPEEVSHNGNIAIAAVNNPRQCVASGETSAIEELEKSLAGRSVVCRRLHTSHAFHSAMMDPVLDRFVQRIQQVALRPPQIPYLSNVTGTWIRAEEATDPQYWGRHLRQTVRFSDCLDELLREPDRILLEIGPGQTLASLARQHSHGAKVFQSLRHPQEKTSDLRFALRTLGDMWVRGAQIDWSGLHPVDSARRVSLPPYPFDHRRFWVNPDTPSPNMEAAPAPAAAPEDGIEQWFYRRVWNRSDLKSTPLGEAATWILFQDAAGLGNRIASELKTNRQKVIRIVTGPSYQRLADGNYTIRPGVRSDYDALITDILKSGSFPKRIIHLWSVLPAGTHPPLDEVMERSFYSPLFLSQALADQDISNLDLAFVSNTMQSVAGEPTEDPARAVLLGPVRVIRKELPGITCRAIDVEIGKGDAPRCATEILAELAASPNDTVVAYRRGERFIEAVERFSPVAGKPRLQAKGVYLVTGGLGGIGLAVAEHLARNFQARLVLVGRSALPPETEWEACLKQENESESTKNKIRTLLELKSHGAEFLIAQADVTRRDEVQNVVDLARQRFGEITGIFHAAGTIEDQPLMLKTVESAARVLGSKVRGTLVLEEVFKGSPLSCFVLFSSISSILPPAGQVDYAAANAFLDAFALSRKGTVTAIDWGLWRDVGMGRASSHPLLGQRLVETAEETLYSSRLSPQNWLLAEHRLKDGRALIPGTGYLEWAAAALHRGSLQGGVAFEDVHFLAPLTFDHAESKASRVRLRREGEAFRFSILSQDGDWIEHATGSISRLTAAPPQRVDRLEITTRCGNGEIVFDEVNRTKQERYFDFGPRWRSLKKIRFGERECLAELELNESLREDCSSWRMHPALLDMATGCALYLTRGYETTRDLYLPVFYKKIRCYSQIPPKVFSHILSRGENVGGGAVAVFDVTLFGEHGQVLVEIEGFTMRRIADPPSLSGSAKAPAEGLRENRSTIEDGDRLTIPVSDGVQSLVRLLHADTPPVVVISPQNPIVPKPSVKAAAAPAPSDSPLPSSEVEATIVGWWRELLGIERIELDDDFFDLGGHSLIAVRLFSKIKKTYHVDLGLAAIFEARTIRKLAALIRNSSSPVGTQDKAWSALVPIQPNGSRTPLFLVHALGPSVLFYEELAKSLPPDQPVYGLQSPLASPQQPRPGRVEELAGIYLDEIQRFLPEGPYLLGGLSFGGMIALEMSLQLYKQGKKPGLLVLLDAFVPGSNLRVAGRDQVTEHWHNIRRRGGSYIWEKLKGKIDYFGSSIMERAALAMARCYRLAGISLPDKIHTLQVEQYHREIMQRYVFQPYPGRITLMRAVDVYQPVGERRDSANGWQQIADGRVDTHDVPGGHDSMMRQPNVKILANELRKVLPR